MAEGIGNVIQFPNRPSRDWSVIERAMDEKLSSEGVPADVQARLKSQMKSFYEMIHGDFGFSIPLEIRGVSKDEARRLLDAIGADVSEAIGKQIQALTYKLFFERFNRELDVCRELGLV